jgi:integrase
MPIHIVLYLMFLARTAKSFSSINLAVCSLAWAHRMAGLLSPTSDVLIVETLNGLKRQLARPTVPKEPFSLENINCIIDVLASESLKDIRDTTMIVLGFFAFLRVDELRQLKCNDIVFHITHLELYIRRSKCDQLRQGNSVVVAKLGGPHCPVDLFLRYLTQSGSLIGDDRYVFRRICSYKTGFQLSANNVPIPYNLVRESVKSKASQIGLDQSKYATHSMRSGGATAAANSNVNERAFQRHGRWATSQSRDRYVKDSLNTRLSVSRALTGE